jgi:hypothetical protein
MFDTLAAPELRTLLNLVSVPVFALDRTNPNNPFHNICMNKSFEGLSYQPRAQVLGRSI